VLIIKIAAKTQRNKFKNINNYNDLPFVSVIVPAKDEESNIANCINSILCSNYPAGLFELIIVNDRSTDKTPDIINSIAQQSKIPVRLCNILSDTNHPNLKGKPRAIKVGIDNANGEIIMMTDADCIVNNS
jgi:glycosyltransferase involved in cell wall biosynthesis